MLATEKSTLGHTYEGCAAVPGLAESKSSGSNHPNPPQIDYETLKDIPSGVLAGNREFLISQFS